RGERRVQAVVSQVPCVTPDPLVSEARRYTARQGVPVALEPQIVLGAVPSRCSRFCRPGGALWNQAKGIAGSSLKASLRHPPALIVHPTHTSRLYRPPLASFDAANSLASHAALLSSFSSASIASMSATRSSR